VDSLQQTNEMSSPQGMSPFPSSPTSDSTPLLNSPIRDRPDTEEGTQNDRRWEKWKKRDADQIAISQTIQNHKNAIYDLAATVEGLEVRWNDVRGYYSYVPFHLFLISTPTLPSCLLSTFLPFVLHTPFPHNRFIRMRRSLAPSLALFPSSLSVLAAPVRRLL